MEKQRAGQEGRKGKGENGGEKGREAEAEAERQGEGENKLNINISHIKHLYECRHTGGTPEMAVYGIR